MSTFTWPLQLLIFLLPFDPKAPFGFFDPFWQERPTMSQKRSHVAHSPEVSSKRRRRDEGGKQASNPVIDITDDDEAADGASAATGPEPAASIPELLHPDLCHRCGWQTAHEGVQWCTPVAGKSPYPLYCWLVYCTDYPASRHVSEVHRAPPSQEALFCPRGTLDRDARRHLCRGTHLGRRLGKSKNPLTLL